jgi:hypothetical protein
MNPSVLLAVLCLGVTSAAPTLDRTLDSQWHEWKTKHRKSYHMVGHIKSVHLELRQNGPCC